jgi:hypothetical protein
VQNRIKKPSKENTMATLKKRHTAAVKAADEATDLIDLFKKLSSNAD